MAPGYNNWFFEGASGSCPSGTVDFTQYHAVQFDILWDTNSTLTINQFNTGSNWPASYVGTGDSNYMATNSGYKLLICNCFPHNLPRGRRPGPAVPAAGIRAYILVRPARISSLKAGLMDWSVWANSAW